VRGEPRQVLRAGVLGAPIAHSLSPVLHRTAYAVMSLADWEYTAHEVQAEELVAFVAGLDESWRGLSLTMPLKEAAFGVADDVTDVASRTGAINTLLRRPDGTWLGDNTDVHGIEAALAGLLAEVEHQARATVLGSGATSRSALQALAHLGFRRVRVAARRPVRAAQVGCVAEGDLDVVPVPLGEWPDEDDVLVVSTLAPAGGLAAAAFVPPSRAGVLLDVVYAGWPTPLAAAAERAGMRVVSGLEMLVHQAAEQVRLMTGLEPPVDAMMAAGRARLGR
jgi:shikimate dehydrogenase